MKPSSPATTDYICFSLGVGDPNNVWAPERHCMWLPDVPRSRSIESFELLFSKLGYIESDHRYERGVRKIAIFALDGCVKHVAVQPPDKKGRWHSKMGSNVNIMHSLDQLVGPEYGRVVRIMREKKPSRARRVRATGTTDG